MIVRKEWQKRTKYGTVIIHTIGWYLFGIIPLYIKRTTIS
jgi:hypothetical protein